MIIKHIFKVPALVIFIFIMITAVPLSAASRAPQPLFLPSTVLNAETFSHFGSEGHVIRSRFVSVDFDSLSSLLLEKPLARENRLIILNLFSDVSLELVLEKKMRLASGGMAFTGRVNTVPSGEAVLIIRNALLVGNITTPDGIYQIRFSPINEHIIREIDQSGYPDELPGIPVSMSPAPADGKKWANDTNPVIDVLVVYTADARTGAGGTAAMEALIDLAVVESNSGYGNSGVLQTLRLVHTEEVDYSESDFSWSDTLSRLRSTSDGHMDNVHELRDNYGADEVALIVNNTASCGIGYVMQTVTTDFNTSAFVVVSRTCATGYYSFAHELGHNMGSAHDRANASVLGAYNYSFGYQAPDGAFRTVMAYNCPGGCTRVNYWSNSGITYGGQAMGVVYTDPLAAENFRSLNQTGPTVAAFRDPAAPGIDVSPESWNYGSIPVGQTASKTFTLTNTGFADLYVSAVAITGNMDFTVTSGGDPFTLNPGLTHDIDVSVTPGSAGIITASLSLTHNAQATNPLLVDLQATGESESESEFPWILFYPGFMKKNSSP